MILLTSVNYTTEKRNKKCRLVKLWPLFSVPSNAQSTDSGVVIQFIEIIKKEHDHVYVVIACAFYVMCDINKACI